MLVPYENSSLNTMVKQMMFMLVFWRVLFFLIMVTIYFSAQIVLEARLTKDLVNPKDYLLTMIPKTLY